MARLDPDTGEIVCTDRTPGTLACIPRRYRPPPPALTRLDLAIAKALDTDEVNPLNQQYFPEKLMSTFDSSGGTSESKRVVNAVSNKAYETPH